MLGAGQAQALVVTVNGQNWNVTTFTGSYNSLTSKFQTPINGGVMPWWGNVTVANSFATAINTSLGMGNGNGGNSAGNLAMSLFFATSLTSGGTFCTPNPSCVAFRYWDSRGFVNGSSSMGGIPSGNTIDPSYNSGTGPILWAQADLITDPAPGPRPALGAAAAFGFSRKLRKRINAGTNPASSTYSLS